MTPPAPAMIARRAMQAVGTPFRLYGREAGIALDCAGLVLHSVDFPNPIVKYSLKGEYLDIIGNIINQIGLNTTIAPESDGDIAVADCGWRQQHLLVRAENGWVHAHAGLQRVVHMPGPCPWPLIAVWRSPGV